jgi:hypothetical protein
MWYWFKHVISQFLGDPFSQKSKKATGIRLRKRATGDICSEVKINSPSVSYSFLPVFFPSSLSAFFHLAFLHFAVAGLQGAQPVFSHGCRKGVVIAKLLKHKDMLYPYTNDDNE